MKYQSNISEIVRIKINQLQDLQNPDQMLRAVALGVLPELKKRVHIEGKDTDGNQIGTYSKGYMVVRTGTYQNAATYKKGANKGKNKDSGTFTNKSAKAGKERPKYNRTADTKVIGSLTRQMENDESVVPTPRGYGIGFKNQANYEKSQYLEHTYRKRIWGLTADEHSLAIRIADAYVNEQFNPS